MCGTFPPQTVGVFSSLPSPDDQGYHGMHMDTVQKCCQSAKTRVTTLHASDMSDPKCLTWMGSPGPTDSFLRGPLKAPLGFHSPGIFLLTLAQTPNDPNLPVPPPRASWSCFDPVIRSSGPCWSQPCTSPVMEKVGVSSLQPPVVSLLRLGRELDK